jgi:hypothetical protein
MTSAVSAVGHAAVIGMIVLLSGLQRRPPVIIPVQLVFTPPPEPLAPEQVAEPPKTSEVPPPPPQWKPGQPRLLRRQNLCTQRKLRQRCSNRHRSRQHPSHRPRSRSRPKSRGLGRPGRIFPLNEPQRCPVLHWLSRHRHRSQQRRHLHRNLQPRQQRSPRNTDRCWRAGLKHISAIPIAPGSKAKKVAPYCAFGSIAPAMFSASP